MKVIINEDCDIRDRERLIRYMQDTLIWEEGRDFAVRIRMPNSIRLVDEAINCVECGQTFTFTVGEQEFFNRHNLAPPKRCSTCRKKRREERAGQN